MLLGEYLVLILVDVFQSSVTRAFLQCSTFYLPKLHPPCSDFSVLILSLLSAALNNLKTGDRNDQFNFVLHCVHQMSTVAISPHS